MNNRDRVEIFWAKDKKDWDLSKLKSLFSGKNIYITFDVDGFDASIMPATGTPEPGGLLWEDVLPIIKKVLTKEFCEKIYIKITIGNYFFLWILGDSIC